MLRQHKRQAKRKLRVLSNVDTSAVAVVDEQTPEKQQSTTAEIVAKLDDKSTTKETEATDSAAVVRKTNAGGAGDTVAAAEPADLPPSAADSESAGGETKKKKKKKKQRDEDDAAGQEAIKNDNEITNTEAAPADAAASSPTEKPDLLLNGVDKLRGAELQDAEANEPVDSTKKKTKKKASAANEDAPAVAIQNAPANEQADEKINSVSTADTTAVTDDAKSASSEAKNDLTAVVLSTSDVNDGIKNVENPPKPPSSDVDSLSLPSVDASAEKSEPEVTVVVQPPVELTVTASLDAAEDEKEGKKKKKKKKATAEEKTAQADGDGNDKESKVAAGVGLRVNEESDFTVRRSSIDDFIRKILAEAREEQKKRTEDLQPSGPAAESSSAASTTASSATEKRQPLSAAAIPQAQPDVVRVNGFGNENGSASGGVATSPSTVSSFVGSDGAERSSEEFSMLDRRLASTDRKRELENVGKALPNAADDLSSVTAAALKPGPLSDKSRLTNGATLPEVGVKTATRNGIGHSGVSEDIDQELAEISRYFSKRTPLNLENGANDDDLVTTEGTGGWLKTRPKVAAQTDDLTADNSDELFAGSFTGGRRFSAQFAEEFAPARRPETDEVVRDRLRPVRVLIDQQADVIQRLKTVAREVSQLDGEISDVRQRYTVDRRSAVESILAAVAEEQRLYEAEQRAADERIMRQLAIVHFVREQFVAATMSSAANDMKTRLGGFDRRSLVGSSSAEPSLPIFIGSSSSLLSPVGLRGPPNFDLPSPSFSRRAQSVAPLGSGEGLDAGRRQRGGSVSRDGATSVRGDSGGGGLYEDDVTSVRRRTTTSATLSPWSLPDAVNGTSETADAGAVRRSRIMRAGSVGPSWYSSTTTELPRGTVDSGDYSEFSRRSTSTNYPVLDAYSPYTHNSSNYSSGLSSDYRRAGAATTGGYSSSLYNSEDSGSSPYVRRYSITDASTPRYSDRYSTRGSYGDVSSYSTGISSGYGGRSSISSSGGEFQSRFLDKVRERKAKAAASSELSSSSTAATANDDKSFKSRFLRTSFDSEPRRYSSTNSYE
jgi:hypothetical protein